MKGVKGMEENKYAKLPDQINKILENGDIFTNVNKYAMKMPQLNTPFGDKDFEKLQKSLNKSSQEKYQREVENNESLKALVQYNEEITNYNKELVNLNSKILNKINSLDDTLLFLNKAFTNKTEIDKEQGQSHNALLLELITIIDSNDEGKLKQFTSGIAAPVVAGLIVEYFKMKLGLSK